MNKEFKSLLLKIATLSLTDQKWILNQLTSRQQELFTQWQGKSLLNKARRFRKLPYPQLPQRPESEQLPDLCQGLRTKTSLYVAIILEQGHFEWEQQFLHSNEQKDEIKQLMKEVVCCIKPATKVCTFKQWQSRLSFIDQLENING
jgi:hypothetical protein